MLSVLVCGKASSIGHEFEDILSKYDWADTTDSLPVSLAGHVFHSTVVSAVCKAAGEFDRRVVKPCSCCPLRRLWLAAAPPHEFCEGRRSMARGLLSMPRTLETLPCLFRTDRCRPRRAARPTRCTAHEPGLELPKHQCSNMLGEGSYIGLYS